MAPTAVLPLEPGGAALGGDPTQAPIDDQRGLPRPPGGSIDIGAFQAQRPTANPDSSTVGQNRPLTVSAPTGLLANDTANDIFSPLVATRITQPPIGQGVVAVNPDGSFTFTPVAGFTGTTTFTYFASDGVTATG